MEINKIYQGDCLKVLQTFPDKTVDCVITSPPYWALRDYGVEGQFGLEPTYNEYISKLCDIFDEIKRILKDEGTIWVNLGDTYNSHPANSKNVGGFEGEQMRNNPAYAEAKVIGKRNCDLPDKCLVQIPARFAIEMANRGWILRNELIWYKRNCMPSSITDRFTVDFEKIFFFTKQKKYWFEPQYEPHQWKDKDNLKLVGKKCKMDGAYNCAINWKGRERSERYGEFGRNKRCVWDITTKPFKEAHFATFPEALIEIPIKAGCPEKICSKCHQARKKVYQKKEYIGPEKEITGKYANSEVHSAGAREHYLSEQRKFTPDQKAVAKFIKGHITSKYHLGILDNEFGKTTWEHWIRTDNTGGCLPSPEDYRKLKGILELPADYDEPMLTTVKVLVDDKGGKDECIGHSDCGCQEEFISGVVLDPFMGSGTTGLVAKKLKRDYIGIELNPAYIEMANRRINEYGVE